MESSSWPVSLPSNRIKAIQELTKGQVLTNKLREMLGRPEKIECDNELVNDVVVQILGMFDNTLSILSSSNLTEIPHNPISDVRAPSSWNDQKSNFFGESVNTVTPNPISDERAPRNWDDKKLKISGENVNTMTPVKTKRGCYKRRKNASTTTKVTSILTDDGYAWRKYGQKVILNSKHQRNYYRCSHKFEQGCQATKQVQKTNDEPPKYKTTYNGFHTCNNLQRTPQIIVEDPNPKDNSTLISFETNTLVENNKVVGTCFQSMKHTHKDGFLSSDQLKQEQVSMMSSGLDCEEMVSSGVFSSTCSTHGYEIDDMADKHDLDDLLYEYYS